MKKVARTNEETKTARERRYFSEAARKEIVKAIDGGLSKSEASRRYQVSEQSIYKWISKYSSNYSKPLVRVVEHQSESLRASGLEKELRQVYEILGRAKAELVFLEQVVKLADEAYGVDIKKNFGTAPLITSTKKGEN